MNTFGEYIKKKRISLGKTLRQFCLETGLDPGNISRLERGKLAPYSSKDKLHHLAKCLKIEEKSRELQEFLDLASANTGRIPQDLAEGELTSHFPLLFRTIREKKFSKDELDELIKKIKEY